MVNLDDILYFTCPDECGTMELPCSLRMILNNDIFYCEACGCEFQGSVYPHWLANAAARTTTRDQQILRDTMAGLYSYLYANGPCPDEALIGQILQTDSNLWTLFPQEKLPVSNLVQLLDNENFAASLNFASLSSSAACKCLERRPDLIDRCSIESFSPKDWQELLQVQPQLITHCSADKIRSMAEQNISLSAMSAKNTEKLFQNFPFKDDYRFQSASRSKGKKASLQNFFDSDEAFFKMVNCFNLWKYVVWTEFSPSNLFVFFKKYPGILGAYPFTADNLTTFDWKQFSNTDWQNVLACVKLPTILQPVYNLCNGKKTVETLAAHPELEQFCNWETLTSLQWTELLIAMPNQSRYWQLCPWDKIQKTHWSKITRDGKNACALAVRNALDGKAPLEFIKKYPGLKKYIAWPKVEATDWLKLLAEFPEYAARCSWPKIYDYIQSLPSAKKQSTKVAFPALWEKRFELLRHVKFPELQKLPADQYYTVLDFFDWEDSFDFAALTKQARIDLFSKHPQFGERFGWEKLSSEEKVALATRSVEFGKSYGWKNFSENEIFSILTQKPHYLQYFDHRRFSKTFWLRLIDQNDSLASHYKLGFSDYLFFRKFNSKVLCSKIVFRWIFLISMAAFAGFGYLVYEGPCGFKAFQAEYPEYARQAALCYGILALLWSLLNAWLFSGRTPFILTVAAGVLGAGQAALQYGSTFFLSTFSASNYICWSLLGVLTVLLILIKCGKGELFSKNRSGLLFLAIFYLPFLWFSFVNCFPYSHGQLQTVSKKFSKSKRPFRSAEQYFLRKTLGSDKNTRKTITELENALKYASFETCETLFYRIPSCYLVLPEIKKLENDLQNMLKNRQKEYTSKSIEAYKKNDYNQLASVIPKADMKNAEIQFILAKCYHLGLCGYKIDFSQAAAWYQKAAAQNQVLAMNNLANLYMEGKGVKKSFEKACTLYTASAKAGCAIAQRNLAFMYLNGRGVSKDLTAAYSWFLKAAKQNDAVSLRQAALMSYVEMGTKRNDKEILNWLTKAAEQNDSIAQQMLGAFYLDGTLGKKDYTAAVALLKKSAAQNNASAQTLLALCYRCGKGVKVDNQAAVHWLQKAAEQNDSAAQCELFEIYYQGKIVTKDIAKAVFWLKKAAAHVPGAQYNLGVCYWNGNGVVQNTAQAEYWLEKAHSNGYVKAKETLKIIRDEIKKQKEKELLEIKRQKQKELERSYKEASNKSKAFFSKKQYKEALFWGLKTSPTDYESICNVAYMYLMGLGTQQDINKAMEYAQRAAAANYPRGFHLLGGCKERQKNLEEAFKYYKKSAEAGWVSAQYDVGCCYLFGDGCRIDYKQAVYWFTQAAAHNFAPAENNLGHMYLNGKGVKRNKRIAIKWLRRAASHGSEQARKTLRTLR